MIGRLNFIVVGPTNRLNGSEKSKSAIGGDIKCRTEEICLKVNVQKHDQIFKL